MSMQRTTHQFVTLLLPVLLLCSSCDEGDNNQRFGPEDMPVTWMTYRTAAFDEGVGDDSSRAIIDRDFSDLKEHFVDLADVRVTDPAQAAMYIEMARKHDLKLGIRVGEDPTSRLVRDAGLQPELAVMNGGVYRGMAIDRHLFDFDAKRHSIIIEPPVYNQGFAYISKQTGAPVGHYFPGMGDPVGAEVVVALKKFDGQQHIAVVSATIERAEEGAVPENDSATPEMHDNPEIQNRQLYRLEFDLSEYGDAMLDQVGLAVYWQYPGYEGTWYMFSRAPVSVCHHNTIEAIRSNVRESLTLWSEAGGGTFPEDLIAAGRWGDENFYLTGHLGSGRDRDAVGYPLWDFSTSFLETFYAEIDNDLTHPRNWGYPEIYGEEVYAWWRYLLHRKCAELAGVVQEEVSRVDDSFLLYRNTTRNSVFSLPNEFDGSGPELLTQYLDVVHLDPYVVMVDGYRDNIVRDMSYYSGLSRRYQKPLIPWVQAITDVGTLKNRGGMRHPTPAQMLRMVDEHREQGIDGLMWLGYGPGRYTYPDGNPDTWEAAGREHKRLKEEPPPKPQAQLAVLRPFSKRALVSIEKGKIRNPADYMLEQMLEVWAVQQRKHYDVYEPAPGIGKDSMESLLQTIEQKYPFVVATEPMGNAWVLTADHPEEVYDPDDEEALRQYFERKLREMGWL